MYLSFQKTKMACKSDTWLQLVNLIHGYSDSCGTGEFSLFFLNTLYLKSPLSTVQPLSSPFLPLSYLKSTGQLTQNVLKLAGFPTTCPQPPLAPLLALSRFRLHIEDWPLANGQLARVGVNYWYRVKTYPTVKPFEFTWHWEPNSSSYKLPQLAYWVAGQSESDFIAQLSLANLGLP